MRYGRLFRGMTTAILLSATGACLAESTPAIQVAEGAKAVLVPKDYRRDGILTVYANNIYVQCLSSHFLLDWRCEAAGLEGQPWLHNVLTPERQGKLIAMGFAPDPQFGNFTASLPRATAPDALAQRILQVLSDDYGVKAEDVEVHSEWLKSARCHQRIMASHDLGGSIWTPKWGFGRDTEKGCHMASNADALNYDDPAAVIPAGATGIDVDARYTAAMAAELQRLDQATTGNPYAIFEAGPAYVQCMPDRKDKRMYCEAVSADAVGKPMERILTPERKAKLLEAGFESPGKVMNYRRFYPRDQYDMTAVAKALLDVLKTAYGYQGSPALIVDIETGQKRRLVP